MKDLWSRNREITALREQGVTLRAIGRRYGLHWERVRQIVVTVRRKQRRRAAESYWGA